MICNFWMCYQEIFLPLYPRPLVILLKTLYWGSFRRFSDTLSATPMNCPPMKIHLVEDYIPYCISTLRQVLLRFQEMVDSVIANLIKSKVITREEGPSEWCSPAFFVPKPDGKSVRLVTDYTKLYRYVKRPVHSFPSVQDIV